MRSVRRLLVVMVLMIGVLTPARSASAETTPIPGPCHQGTLPGGALSLICVPLTGWNGDLMVFAHGYVAFNQPLGFYDLTLPDGAYLPNVAQLLGFAFATTSYRTNGLAILPGEDDVRQLIAAVPGVIGQAPNHTYLTGVSEGGLVTTLLLEQSPQLISGGLAACGPIGSFRDQVTYFGDFRVLFDYFFPGVLPPSPILIPPSLIANWDSTYVPAVAEAVSTHPDAARQLIRTSNAAIDPTQPAASTLLTTVSVLWYNVFATDDAELKLGGNPYDNEHRIYRGSSNDIKLNREVERFDASPTALANLAPYETTGNVTIPLVTLHTTADEIIPFWQELLYRAKVHPSGNGQLTQIPVVAYGHCAFTTQQLLGAFAVLVQQAGGPPLALLDLSSGPAGTRLSPVARRSP